MKLWPGLNRIPTVVHYTKPRARKALCGVLVDRTKRRGAASVLVCSDCSRLALPRLTPEPTA